MGCRCCKMIQSYIFDPQEVQPSGYVNEINYKPDEQDGGKFKCKQNNDVQPHNDHLQKAEIQPAANRHKLNNTKGAAQNHRSTFFHEEELGNSVEKCNGVHSYPNPNTNQSRESSTHVYSGQLSDSSAKRISQPQTCDNHEIPNIEVCRKLPSETTENFHYEEFQSTGENISSHQSAILDMQGNGAHPPGPSYPKNASHAGKLKAAGSKSASNHSYIDQNIECTAGTKQSRDLPWCEPQRSDSGDKACRTGPLNACFKNKTSSDAPYPQAKTDVQQEAEYDCHEEVNGEVEEEDADVAEALAALEAATAGEDSEEDEKY
ncbi:PDCD10 and GCKIII kinases-associated protein 1 [Pogona vitticeps]|nr:uncharacterized protein C4orf19 homolog [Pogona vitticeps]XP_020641842.1 uncharacterized protein C4orf19 homolog [Pogona vitticeps]XP_020641843.1 uncharacterized protein C4orf19 homolog [Pogona vitticeps]XP_020641844.1 uncharacterized protein C4orf19 homolog [Pogona vitticeps]